MNKSMWNNEAVKAYESGQGVVLVEKPYPHYVPLNDTSIKEALAQRKQDGECKYCTNGCPACDARKLQKEAHDLL
jgi:hypothetical protein